MKLKVLQRSTRLTLNTLMILLFANNILFAQEVVSIQDTWKINRAVPVIEQVSGRLVMILFDDSRMSVIEYDEDFNAREVCSSKDIPLKYSNLHGVSSGNNSYKLYFSNETNNHFLIRTINIASKSVLDTTLSLPSKANESFLESIIINNKLYLLTIKFNSSVLKLYSFMDDQKIVSNTLDFSKSEFRKSDRANLFTVLNAPDSEWGFQRQITRVYENNISTMATCSRTNKLYATNGKLILTLNNEHLNTKVITIIPDALSGSLKVFESPAPGEQKGGRTNSFIYDNKLFQVYVNQASLTWNVIDLVTGNVIPMVDFSIDGDNLIESIKNPAISVRESGDAITIAIGSCANPVPSTNSEYIVKGASVSGGMGQGIASPQTAKDYSFIHGYNPLLKEFFSGGDVAEHFFLLSAKELQFTQNGHVVDKVYEPIREYLNTQHFDPSSLALFRIMDKYYAGFFSKDSQQFVIVRM